jgi:hypothetical protein
LASCCASGGPFAVLASYSFQPPIEITSARTAALIPNAQLKIYRNAPHGLVITHLSQLEADIADFASSDRADFAWDGGMEANRSMPGSQFREADWPYGLPQICWLAHQKFAG